MRSGGVSRDVGLNKWLVSSMNAGSLSGRTGAIKEVPKGKNKYTLAPIDHLKSAQKVGN
jgi:hypothetical protein